MTSEEIEGSECHTVNRTELEDTETKLRNLLMYLLVNNRLRHDRNIVNW